MPSVSLFFPDGIPGAGLLFLRASTAFSLVSMAWPFDISDWRDFAAALTASGILIGVKTRVLAALGIVMAIAHLVGGASLADVGPISLTACALALVGPGAYSADARLFGRLTVMLPPNSGRRD